MNSITTNEATQPVASAASKPCTAFIADRLLVSGPLIEVALGVKQASENPEVTASILTFDDTTGRVVDLDLRGSKADIVARFVTALPAAVGVSEPATLAGRGRGRPKLGVVAREVTLLPRHWEWLATQRGGASATLRRLVDEARKAPDPAVNRAATEVAYRFMAAMAGNFPNFEEASRALFAGDLDRLEVLAEPWSDDVRAYLFKLLG